jgi:hypothetical protein
VFATTSRLMATSKGDCTWEVSDIQRVSRVCGAPQPSSL